MIFLKFGERIWDRPGKAKQVSSTPFHSCMHQIIHRLPTPRQGSSQWWLSDWFLYVRLLVYTAAHHFWGHLSLQLFVLFPNCCLGCLMLTLLLKLLQTAHLSTQSLTLPPMHQLPVTPEQKVMKGDLWQINLPSFHNQAYRAMHICLGLDST